MFQIQTVELVVGHSIWEGLLAVVVGGVKRLALLFGFAFRE